MKDSRRLIVVLTVQLSVVSGCEGGPSSAPPISEPRPTSAESPTPSGDAGRSTGASGDGAEGVTGRAGAGASLPSGASDQAGQSASAAGSSATAGSAAAAGTAGSARDDGTGGGGAGGAAGRAGTTSSTAGTAAPGSAERTLPPVDDVNVDGPFEVMVDQRGGASSWIFRPTELGKDGAKHPVFVFGNGAGGSPSFYQAQMSRIASHGIIVMHPTNSMVGAQDLKAALDWILAENERPDSIFYQKLNGRAAAGGHSLGSLATFDLEVMETRLTTTLHIAGGSMDRMGSSKVKTITAYICGDTDFARENCEADWETVGAQPTFFSILEGTDHIPAVERALPGMVAWLRWQLAGETERKAQFTGPDGDFFTGIWMSQTKNW